LAIISQESGDDMRLSRLFALLPPLLLACTLCAAQAQNETQAQKEENVAHMWAPLKVIHTEEVPYPEEALKKGIEGKVTLSIAVDAKGNVSQSKALSGPPELFQAAIDSTKLWKFEPPPSAPVVKTVEVSYGFPKECPGPISDAGEVTAVGHLNDKDGKPVAVFDNDDIHLPPYPEEERKAGVAGEMILSVTLSHDGYVKEVHAVKSLSPGLDKAAIDTVRPLKFKRWEGNSDASLEDLRLKFGFHAICNPHF